MKKPIISILLCISMILGIVGPLPGWTAQTASAKGGSMTLPVMQDCYVQGSSQASAAKGTEDPNNLSGRDWSDKAGVPSAYQLPYLQFELPSRTEFASMDDIHTVTLKMFCISGKNDEYIAGLSNLESFDEKTFTYNNALSGEKPYPAGANQSKRLNFDHPETRIEGSNVSITKVSNEWLEFDITEKVKEMIEANTSGQPKTVVLTVAPRSREDNPDLAYHGVVMFASKEYQGGICAPKIEINSDARVGRSKKALDDFYTDPEQGEVRNGELKASTAQRTVLEFSTQLDIQQGDTLAEGKVVLALAPGSAEAEGLVAELLDEPGSATGTRLEEVILEDGVLTVGVQEELIQCMEQNKNLVLRISSDNGESTPLIFRSSRADEEASVPRMLYEVIYQGSIKSLRPAGSESVEISLTGVKEEYYTFEALDQYQEPVNGAGFEIVFSLDSAPDGVSISTGGQLLITPEAVPGIAVIRAARADMPEISGTLDVAVTLSPPADIQIAGAAQAKVPEPGQSRTKPYRAMIYNEAGTQMPPVWNISWRVIDAPNGITVESGENGAATLVIDNRAGNLKVGDAFTLEAAVAEHPDVTCRFTVTLSVDDEVYSTIRIPVAQDTYIKQGDYAKTGNIDSGELLAKLNTKTASPDEAADYFEKEGTNREIYLQFDGLDDLPEKILSGELVLTTKEDYAEAAGAPALEMPKAEVFQVTAQDWLEREGSITSRLPVQTPAAAEAAYALEKGAQTRFDLTEQVQSAAANGEGKMSFRVGMEPVNNNSYVHKYYSKEGMVLNDATGLEEPAAEEQKPYLAVTASYVRRPAAIEIVGKKQVGIMMEDAEEGYRVYLLDQYGQRYTDDEMNSYHPTLALVREYPGVHLEGAVLKVSSSASAGTLKLTARIAELPELSDTQEITLYQAEAASVVLNGPDTIQIPPEGETATAEYSMAVYDQNGNRQEVRDLVYGLASPQVGVVVDKRSGSVKVSDYAVANRTFVIEAYSESHKAVRGEKTVRVLPAAGLSGREQHPSLLYSNADLPALREKINVEPFASYYSQLKQKADTYSTEEITYLASTDPREAEDEFDHAYPLVEVGEDGREKVLDRKRPWQFMMTDLFYTQGNFTFTPPDNAVYIKAQAIAKGQGITNFDNVTFKMETGTSFEVDNASFETGNLRYVDENLPYTDGEDYQVVAASADGEWEYLNDVKKPMPDGWNYIRRKGSEVEFEWDDQSLHRDKVTSEGQRAAKIRNHSVQSEAGISSGLIKVMPGQSYVLSTGFGANDKLVGEQGRLPEYAPLDKTAGLYMQVFYYDADGNEIGQYTWFDTKQSKPMNINWQVKPLRRSFDDMLDACAAVYAVTRNVEYAIRAKEILKYQLEDMKWGMRYRTTTGYNNKMNDSYEAVHTGRHLQRDALTYDMIFDSGVISPEEDAQLRDLFNWVAFELTQTSYYNYSNASGQIHNYNADRVSALILYSLCFPENKGSEQNKYKDTFEFFYHHVMDDKNVWSFPTLLKNGIYDAGEAYGGMWCENIRYHGSVYSGWLLASKALDRFNPEFHYLESEEMRKMARMWCTAQGPRLTVSTDAKNLAGYPTVGDSSWRESVDLAAWCASIFQKADPELSRELMYTWDRMGSNLGGSYPINILMDNDPTLPRKNPQLGSFTLDKVGYTYFRQNFDILGKENFVLIPNSPGYGNKNQVIHDHSDRGSFAFFANGTPMSLDSGMGSYFGSDSAFWRSSKSHNEILFWSDQRGWLSNAGGDGNSYTSDTGKTKNYDSETKDFFTNQEIDRVTIDVNPAVRAGKETNLQWNRHYAYLKDGINALVFWDECLNTRKSQFNLFLASTSYEQKGNVVTAQMQNNMQLDVYLLGSRQPDLTAQWVPSAGKYGIPTVNGEESQQLIQYEQEGGQDYLTVLYPKNDGAQGLNQSELNTGVDGVKSYRLTQGNGGNSFYIVYNDSGNDQEILVGNTTSIRNPQTGEVLSPGAKTSIQKGKMLIWIDDRTEVPRPQRIELSGEKTVGVPSGDGLLSYSYEARVFDQYGNTMDGAETDYSVTGSTGCSVSKDGTLIVDSRFPDGGKAILSASYQGISARLEITASSAGTAPVSVEIDGTNTLVIPDTGSQGYSYRAVFKNASNTEMSGMKPVWTLLDKTEGVSVNSYTGQVTVESTVKPRSIIHLNVTHYNDPSITRTLEIVLLKAEESGIFVNAPEELALSSAEDTVIRLTGYATDQMGNPYRNTGVTYALKHPIEGVCIGAESGQLTVQKGTMIPGGSITVLVKSKGSSTNITQVRIRIVENGPAQILLFGPDLIQMQHQAKQVEYRASVLDKNGAELTAGVVWSVRGISGAVIDPNGMVSLPAEAAGTLRVTAAGKDAPEITATKNVTVKQKSPGGGSGGGSGGNSGEGGFVSGGSGLTTPTAEPAGPNFLPFSDVPASHWASGSIESLYRDGIVQGKSADRFEPDSPVTRAEFVKMLVGALDVRTAGAERISFTDVQTDDWYYPYVVKAVTAGIVQGYSEEFFGADDRITREQMAAMVCRALNFKGIELIQESQVRFRDLEAVSEYARPFVLSLAGAGILNGREEGLFSPQGQTTRAEAAKVLDLVRKWNG